ncbi:MAG: hypothetical protein ACPGYV_12700, partial [Phycisphaeraceae bacterium]
MHPALVTEPLPDRFALHADRDLPQAALLARREAAVASRDAAAADIRNARVQLDRELYSPRSNSSGSAPGGMGMPAMMD